MSDTDIAAQFYDHVRENKLTAYADQWGSLTSCAQYRLPYAKTLQYVQRSALCLDWGCGNGHFSYFLTHAGFHTCGYSFELLPSILAAAPHFNHKQGELSDPFSLPYEAATFDAVFSMGVLEHVHESGGDQARSIREVERLLKPGGLFLIFHLPNQGSWIEFLVRVLKRSAHSNKHAHSKLFTRESFESLLQGTSFEIIDVGRYNTLPRNSFNRLPLVLSNQRWVCGLVNALDDLLTWMIPAVSQNWFFILRKKASV